MNKQAFIFGYLNKRAADIEKGDTILLGRFKNVKATVNGFGKDEHNQPTVKTNKGEYSLYRFRIAKLLKDYNSSKQK